MSLPPPQFDPVLVLPELGTATAALAAGDWVSFRNLFMALDWGGRSAICANVDTDERVGNFLRAVAEADATDMVAATVLASHLINAGWKMRTAARASHVSAEQFRVFHDFVRRAERILIDVTALEPALVTAWEHRLTTARALGLGQAEARRRYDRLAKVVPNHLPGQSRLLQQLCPKWSGTFEKAHAFGRECMLSAPEGAVNAVIVAEGHIERWLELESGEDKAYIQSPAVRAGLAEAADRSVLHPAFQRTHGWVSALNHFACALSMARDWQRAAACFVAMGPYATNSPWSYLGDPPQVFVVYRNQAMREAGAR
jgi:hypothetical protein